VHKDEKTKQFLAQTGQRLARGEKRLNVWHFHPRK
jgi:hypothetical protein